MKIIKNFFTRAFSGNSLIHALLMAFIGGLLGTLYPIVQAWLQGQPVPALMAILTMALKGGIGALIAYLIKNGGFGSANVPTVK